MISPIKARSDVQWDRAIEELELPNEKVSSSQQGFELNAKRGHDFKFRGKQIIREKKSKKVIKSSCITVKEFLSNCNATSNWCNCVLTSNNERVSQIFRPIVLFSVESH